MTTPRNAQRSCERSAPSRVLKLRNRASASKATAEPAPFDPAVVLIRMPDVEAIVGLARPTIYKLMQQKESGFPLPVKLSDSNSRGAPVAWVLSEVQDWVRARIAARKRAAA
ncbi:TPA: AlpA family phage regulatory protein [Pseudomonas aeruginosa]|nr:AlpA family phage regulatory protein [Pseudomonas aeruginosa]AUA93242.1 AlpA family phage regulatory protein [Pseudomonas aeruginosa]ELG5196920.1 AlpA family phage regulatory protein [Pseudomonas aeruginosa]ELQ3329471.1 AlpA family phage regulatory protein [Pseudomonas aeruginosa]KAA5633726.1 AlpA family phage regulatory protein [Pseudomonas aeruginosa]